MFFIPENPVAVFALKPKYSNRLNSLLIIYEQILAKTSQPEKGFVKRFAREQNEWSQQG